MKSPVQKVFDEFFLCDVETADEEGNGYCAVDNGVFRTDIAAVFGYVREEVGQETGQADADEEPLSDKQGEQPREYRLLLLF